MADVTYVPENQANNILPYFLAGQNNNGGFFGANGGSAFWGALLGSVVPGLFGGWGNGWGGFGGGSGAGAAAASLGAQATANNNAELILNAINGTDADVRLLATTLNTDVDSIKLGINTVQGAIAQVASQVGMSGLQVVNAIQSGNADLASRLCSCCCDMKQLVTEQGYQSQLATLNQTNALTNSIADLKAEMISQFCASEKRDMQDKINTQGDIITQLRSQIDNDRQTAQFAAMLAPLQAQVNTLVARAPQTVPVIWPQLTVSQTSPATTPTTTGA
jgi:hypothetical protein